MAAAGSAAGPGPHRRILGLNPSTVHRVLARHGLPRPAWLDRPTGKPVRRYERAHPGELVHVDVTATPSAVAAGGGVSR